MMKKIIAHLTAVLCFSFIIDSIYSQTTIITDDDTYTTGENTAVLDVKSTGKGFLPPRMTTIQREAIIDPAEGLIIFNITTGCIDYFHSNAWYEWCGNLAPFICGTSKVRFTYNGASVTYGTVVGADGKCWLDRNMGASQVATSSTDAASYGHLFQWGRLDDGHQVRTSPTTTTLSNTDVPGHGNFILKSNYPYDWRSPQNNNLWQGLNGTNNPCPEGFRIPTDPEWDAERQSWSSSDAAGAFSSPLKLTMGGYRSSDDGTVLNAGSFGAYWSSTISTVDAIDACYLSFQSGGLNMSYAHRALGLAVRCIED